MPSTLILVSKAEIQLPITVAAIDQSMHATPLDKNGKIKPYNKPLVDPIKYFEQRLKSLQW
jgi:hypothetical protein